MRSHRDYFHFSLPAVMFKEILGSSGFCVPGFLADALVCVKATLRRPCRAGLDATRGICPVGSGICRKKKNVL
jgi:hypothetical protein